MLPETQQVGERVKDEIPFLKPKLTLLAAVCLFLASLTIFSRAVNDFPLSPISALFTPLLYGGFIGYSLFSDKLFSAKILYSSLLFVVGMTLLLTLTYPTLGMLVLNDGMGLGPIIFIFKITFYTVVLIMCTVALTKLRITLEHSGRLIQGLRIMKYVTLFAATMLVIGSLSTVIKCGIASCRDLENVIEKAIAAHSINICNNFVVAPRNGSSEFYPFGGDDPKLASWVLFYDFFPAPLRKNMMSNDDWYRDDFFKKNGYDFTNDCYYKQLKSEHSLVSKEELPLCEALPNNTSRGLCMNSIAVATKDSSLCTRFEETGFNRGGELALESCLVKTTSLEQVDKIFETDDNGFLISLDPRFLREDSGNLFYNQDTGTYYTQQLYRRNQAQYHVIMAKRYNGASTYTGIVLQDYYSLSPSNQKMVYLNKNNELCVIHLVSKQKQCISPKEGEAFYKGADRTTDTNINWIDDSSFQYRVFEKNSPAGTDASELRRDIFTLSPNLTPKHKEMDDGTPNFSSAHDEYGFPVSVNMQKYSYNEPILLYEKNGYRYVQLVNESEGAKPIAEISPSSARRYLGVMYFSGIDKLSPDKHKYTFVGYVDERICIVQINPKNIQCTQPTSPYETYVARGGDYDAPYVDGEWINNNTVQFSVFTKEQGNMPGVHDVSHPLRKETFTFK